MKARRPFECIWPWALGEALARYLMTFRPVLLGAGSTDALWISKSGSPLSKKDVAFRITTRTAQAFGVAINPHMFRHIAATAIASREPESIEAASKILGHAGLSTLERHYNKATSDDACSRYYETIRALRAPWNEPDTPAPSEVIQ
jgi:site-specific recombinase XerD